MNLTLHCNKIELHKCPLHIAKMCVHDIGTPVNTNKNAVHNSAVFALERYLIWARRELPIKFGNGSVYWEDIKKYESFEEEVKSVMGCPDLKVWVE
jgi:hypothetical protein